MQQYIKYEDIELFVQGFVFEKIKFENLSTILEHS